MKKEIARQVGTINAFAKGVHRSYVICALMLLNTLITFVLFNLGLFATIRLRDFLYSDSLRDSQKTVALKPGQLFNSDGSPVDNGKRTSYELYWFDFAAYENINASYAGEVLTDFYEFRKLGYIYQPWVEFSEPPFTGQRVNVDLDSRGFPVRRTVNPPNDRNLPVVEIFALGGSSTFGYHVSDEHTWPSHLSKILNEKAQAEGLSIHVEVVNYGRAFYNPSQETVLLVDLLKSGHRPSLVLFMDGLNQSLTPDVPYFTPRISHAVRNMQFNPPLINAFEWLPVVRFANSIKRRWFKIDPDEEQETKRPVDLHRVDQIVNAFEQNKQIASTIAELYGIKTLFFLQPHVTDYNLELFRRPLPDLAEFLRSGQQEIRPFYARLRTKAEWVDLSDLFELWGKNRKAIVDDCHYSPNFHQFLAKHVAEYINLRPIKPPPAIVDDAAATGEAKRVGIRHGDLLR